MTEKNVDVARKWLQNDSQSVINVDGTIHSIQFARGGPMPKKDYRSHIGEPVNHTTPKGGSYVEPFDVIRSNSGRAVISRHSGIKSTAVVIRKEPNGSDPESNFVGPRKVNR